MHTVARTSPPSLRVLIVAEHASASFGGEAALPLHYFRVLRRRGIAVWLLTHARTRDELSALYPNDPAIRYIEDSAWHRLLWRIGQRLPARLSYFSTGFLSRLATQICARRLARRLVVEQGIDVVHQPMPVSPREPSLLARLGAPVVIGPMNGGMDYPPGFLERGGGFERGALRIARAAGSAMNVLMPGKRQASLLLVANRRTRAALPAGVRSRVVELCENGADMSLWQSSRPATAPTPASAEVRFVYLGRLVDWKGVDYLLRAFARASRVAPMRLVVVGDGEEKAALEALAVSLGLAGDDSRVRFAGWLPQARAAEQLAAADVLVLPSLLECGGAVVLEAMAMAKPVIATDWGGPADYLDPSCGILVAPTSPPAFVDSLAEALLRLAASPSLRARMGANGRRKVEREYDWERKVDLMLRHYRAAVAEASP